MKHILRALKGEPSPPVGNGWFGGHGGMREVYYGIPSSISPCCRLPQVREPLAALALRKNMSFLVKFSKVSGKTRIQAFQATLREILQPLKM